MIRLHDLCGRDPARRFSPYCWRVRLALAHKGLDHECLPWRFTERAAIADAGAGKVPVLRDDATGRVVHDSLRILEYLEEAHPDRPPLFGGPGGLALARFATGWADAATVAAVARLVVSDIPRWLGEEDAAYFTRTREARFGMPLAEVTAGREARVGAFRRDTLAPLRAALRRAPFLHGERPGAADYVAFGGFQWARMVSAFPLLDPADRADPVHAWRARVLDLFDGLARDVPHEDATA